MFNEIQILIESNKYSRWQYTGVKSINNAGQMLEGEYSKGGLVRWERRVSEAFLERWTIPEARRNLGLKSPSAPRVP